MHARTHARTDSRTHASVLTLTHKVLFLQDKVFKTLSLVRELVRSGWMMSTAEAVRAVWTCVQLIPLDPTTVRTTKTLA